MRENKSNKPKKRMPSLSKRKKGKLSPKNWYIKRAPSYSTNALAAKVYLQNGRVVVPDFKDYKAQIEENRNQSSRSRSRSNRPMSSKTQTNSSSIIKPMAPIGMKPRLKKKQRPFTAASQTNRFSSGEPSKLSIKTSHKNLYDSGYSSGCLLSFLKCFVVINLSKKMMVQVVMMILNSRNSFLKMNKSN